MLPIDVKVDIPQFDKLVHGGLYLAFAWLLTQAIRVGSRLPAALDPSDEGAAQAGMPERDYLLWAWMYATSYGLLIELLQAFLPWRSASAVDALANAAGAAAGVWVGRSWPTAGHDTSSPPRAPAPALAKGGPGERGAPGSVGGNP